MSKPNETPKPDQEPVIEPVVAKPAKTEPLELIPEIKIKTPKAEPMNPVLKAEDVQKLIDDAIAPLKPLVQPEPASVPKAEKNFFDELGDMI